MQRGVWESNAWTTLASPNNQDGSLKDGKWFTIKIEGSRPTLRIPYRAANNKGKVRNIERWKYKSDHLARRTNTEGNANGIAVKQAWIRLPGQNKVNWSRTLKIRDWKITRESANAWISRQAAKEDRRWKENVESTGWNIKAIEWRNYTRISCSYTIKRIT